MTRQDDNRLSRNEKAFARAAGITAKDVHIVRGTSYGTLYGLYNKLYLCEMVFYGGYSKAEIYRILLRRLIEKCGITER